MHHAVEFGGTSVLDLASPASSCSDAAEDSSCVSSLGFGVRPWLVAGSGPLAGMMSNVAMAIEGAA